MKRLLCPSMMCADFSSLEKEIENLDTANIDIYHIDIMDGQFVPNFGMGLQDLEYIRSKTTKLVDVHLMIQNPSNYIDLFAEKGADIIYFHPETDMHPTRTIDRIRANGVKPGIAINPGTSIASIEGLLSLVDYVLVMTVNPGFAGQKYLSFVDEKIKALTGLKEQYSYEIMVDGAISPEVIERLSALGVDGFILGTSSLFGKEESYEIIVDRLRQNTQGAVL
jgi:ribulose-phosphate 3-epimerase